jgi:cbb3-type cytochrome oxidase subunit 3
MEVYSTLASIFTVVSFFVFACIVCWAWSARRKASFDAAAIEPFALPDEAGMWDPNARAHASRAAGSIAISSEGARP